MMLLLMLFPQVRLKAEVLPDVPLKTTTAYIAQDGQHVQPIAIKPLESELQGQIMCLCGGCRAPLNDCPMMNCHSKIPQKEKLHDYVEQGMSRDAIVNIMNNGGDGGNTVKAIVDRFPTEVRADVYNSKGEVTAPGQTMSIEDWHNSSKAGNLKTTAFEKLFPTMNWSIKQKMAPGAAKDLGTFFTAPPPHTPF